MPTLEWIGKEKVINHHQPSSGSAVPGAGKAVCLWGGGQREHGNPRRQFGGAESPLAAV